MKKFIISLLICISTGTLFAQDNLLDLQPEKEYDNIHVQKLYSDSLSTSFVIWVKKSVKAHKHALHTESLYVLEGNADMKLGDKSLKIKAGDFLTIPKNTIHSVIVTSDVPLKVISIQAPEFIGTDRIFIE